MSERSGVGVVELVILEVLDSLGAGPDRPRIVNSTVLAEVEARIGLAPGYAYQVLVELARWWTVPVRLVHGEGNYGELRDDLPAAHPRYTESRLSRAGEVVLAAERGQLAPVPAGLINGSAYRGGSRPPFRPERLIEAVRQVIRRPRVAGAELVEIVGMPEFPTGCTVIGDRAALAAGLPTVLRLQAEVSVIGDLAALVAGHPAGPWPWARAGAAAGQWGVLVEHMPPNVSRPAVMKEISNVANGQITYSGGDARLPIRAIVDIALSGDDRFICLPEPGTAPELLRDLLLNFEGVTTTMPAELPGPLPDMIMGWVRAYQDEGLLSSLASLEAAIATSNSGNGPNRPDN
jgi:hypothetical protein